MYKESDTFNSHEMLCGAASNNKYSKRDISEEEEPRVNVTLTPQENFGRRLQAVQRWTNCFPNDEITRRFNIAFYVDYGYSAVGFIPSLTLSLSAR